jgi:hypothetical protein
MNALTQRALQGRETEEAQSLRKQQIAAVSAPQSEARYFSLPRPSSVYAVVKA